MRTLVIATIVAVGLSLTALAQIPRPRVQPEMLKTTDGEEIFKFYCSNCHGLDAKGRPATTAVRTPPPDLTVLAAANGGVFPRDRVEAVIVHGSVATLGHGPKDMPVWGAIFRALELNDTAVQIRIESLVRYLESLQGQIRPSAH